MGFSEYPQQLGALPSRKKLLSRPGLRQHISRCLERTSTENGRMGHLDGVRAVALVGVLLFHFGIPGASGGFLGK